MSTTVPPTATAPDRRLEAVEAYYDLVPRAATTVEEVGPFTLFLAAPGSGMTYYARPRRNPARGGRPGMRAAATAADVQAVLARQRDLGVRPALEWVDEVEPDLLGAVRDAGFEPEQYPILTLDPSVPVEADPRCRILPPAGPHLALALGAVHAGFADRNEIDPVDPGPRSGLVARGDLVVVASFEGDALAGAGSTAPRGPVAELMGIAVPPRFRGRGHGSGITRTLVVAAREADARLVFLSAGSDSAANIYRRIGFVDVGTACVLELDD